MKVERLDGRAGLERLTETPSVVAAFFRLLDWRLVAPPWPGFPRPFAGQWARSQALRALIAAFAPDSVIETGTFLGLSTSRLATTTSIPVYSIEIKPAYYHLAKLNLHRCENVSLICGDSRSVLANLQKRPSIARPLAYLDAHWWEPLPLHEELRILFGGWPEVVVAIDDFRVPDDPGYGYDVYNGIPLSLEELVLPDSVKLAFPAICARREGGARRGTLYLAQGPGAERALDEVTRAGLIRPFPRPVSGACRV
jgi:hypothetical protein